jgi:CheY-like chemotaxis protein
MTGTRVVLAEDDVLLREGLGSLLDRSGLEVVGLAGDRPQLLALVRQTTPDLVVIDIHMPPSHTTEGLEAAAVIRSELPGTGILVLSADADVEHVMELLSTGRGFHSILTKLNLAEAEDDHRRVRAVVMFLLAGRPRFQLAGCELGGPLRCRAERCGGIVGVTVSSPEWPHGTMASH